MIPTRSFIIGLVIGISIILISGTQFQTSTNHFETGSAFSANSNTKFAFAQTDGEVNGDTTLQPPAEEQPSAEEQPPAELPNGNNTQSLPLSPDNGTSTQELSNVENASQAVSGVAIKAKDKDPEKYLDETRDERVDRHICLHSPYYGEWNYDTNRCEISDSDLKQKYEKEQKKNSRFDKLICPRYGGEWNESQKSV